MMVAVLLAVIGTGVLAALYFEPLRLASYWFFNARTYVKSQAQERTLLEEQTPFKECRDCPEVIFVTKGVLRRGGPLRGSPDPDGESPLTDVEISRSFAVSVTEITFSQWDVCASQGACRLNVSAGEWGRGNQPLIRVSWAGAQDYAKMDFKSDWKAIPTAFRSGVGVRREGRSNDELLLPDTNIDQYAWHAGNSEE